MRDSYFEVFNSRKTKLKNIGFDYSKSLLKKSLSTLLYADPNKAEILGVLNWLVVYLVNSVKTIKRSMNYILPKNFDKFN